MNGKRTTDEVERRLRDVDYTLERYGYGDLDEDVSSLRFAVTELTEAVRVLATLLAQKDASHVE